MDGIMNNLDEGFLEQNTTNSNLIRGKILFNSSAVRSVMNINQRFFFAHVRSGRNSYAVFLENHGDTWHGSCSCTYKSSGLCKHTIAALFTLMDWQDGKKVRLPLVFKKELPSLLAYYRISYYKFVVGLRKVYNYLRSY